VFCYMFFYCFPPRELRFRLRSVKGFRLLFFSLRPFFKDCSFRRFSDQAWEFFSCELFATSVFGFPPVPCPPHFFVCMSADELEGVLFSGASHWFPLRTASFWVWFSFPFCFFFLSLFYVLPGFCPTVWAQFFVTRGLRVSGGTASLFATFFFLAVPASVPLQRYFFPGFSGNGGVLGRTGGFR